MTIDIQQGDCLDVLRGMDSGIAQLILTSPPYNVGKEYEIRRSMTDYVEEQKAVIEQCSRILKPGGSLCWQVGNHISDGEVVPLDAVLYPAIKLSELGLRNRIIWTFGHGLHAKNRFSGRHESVLWATKGKDYLFNLDAVRTPQKYPNKKHYKGAAMAIRLRTVSGERVALCAAETDAMPGDVYLDDREHESLAAKFAADWHGQTINWRDEIKDAAAATQKLRDAREELEKWLSSQT